MRFVHCLLIFGLLIFGLPPSLHGQAPPAGDLERVGERLVRFFKEKRPGWEHSTVEPLAAPGQQPSRNVAIHFWRSDKCLIVDATIDGEQRKALPVYCKVKVAVYLFPTIDAARAHLDEFAQSQRTRKAPWTLRPVALGDEGYGWGLSNVVFRKGRYSFWLDTVIGNSYGLDQFALEREATEAFAADVSRAVSPN
ncbi:MAG TPA: hypothetical protein VF656_03795 [Pyrinomonadaceae bacterium]